MDGGIRNGYVYAKKAIRTIVSDEELADFVQYFLHSVVIIHYDVPKDVDLNHYFEVMNSRGEQLEKHEIVKSTLSQYLDGKQLATFSRIWEACSEMNVYIQQAFPNETVFDNHLNRFLAKDFDSIPIVVNESEGKDTILNLMERSIQKFDDAMDGSQPDKFQPIIDFPNFLLIVLKLTLISEHGFDPAAFILDDKELLNEFMRALNSRNNKSDFAKLFVFNLLKAKYFLDNYIVHHTLDDKEFSGDNPWKLQQYYREGNKKYPRNIAKQEQDELVHLLSMFEVAFTQRQRKNYLLYCLMFLFEHNEITGGEYLEFMQKLASKYFYDVYLDRNNLTEKNQPKPNAFDNTILVNGKLNVDRTIPDGVDYRYIFNTIYKQGSSDISLYVFNYTDYIIWKRYADTLRGHESRKGSDERNSFFSELGCSDFDLDLDRFNHFYFSRTRKSLEHYYPQAKAGDGKPLSADEINCFGNFAMIGAEANSSGSNWDPKTKLDHYLDGKSDQVSTASLKFRIMMQICEDNQQKRAKGLEWNYDDIQLHQLRMLDILF